MTWRNCKKRRKLFIQFSLILFSKWNSFLTKELARLRLWEDKKIKRDQFKIFQVKKDKILGNKEVYLNKTFGIAELKGLMKLQMSNCWFCFLSHHLNSPYIVLRAYSQLRNFHSGRSIRSCYEQWKLCSCYEQWQLSPNLLPCPSWYRQCFVLWEFYIGHVPPRRKTGTPSSSAASFSLEKEQTASISHPLSPQSHVSSCIPGRCS